MRVVVGGVGGNGIGGSVVPVGVDAGVVRLRRASALAALAVAAPVLGICLAWNLTVPFYDPGIEIGPFGVCCGVVAALAACAAPSLVVARVASSTRKLAVHEGGKRLMVAINAPWLLLPLPLLLTLLFTLNFLWWRE